MPLLRTRLTALTCAAAAALTTAGSLPASAAPEATSLPALRTTHPGLDRLLAGGSPTGRAIVELDSVPTTAQVGSLEDLGLSVRPLHRLPMAVVEGTTAQMAAAVTSGIGTDVYPDEVL
jgi:serine protease AprX